MNFVRDLRDLADKLADQEKVDARVGWAVVRPEGLTLTVYCGLCLEKISYTSDPAMVTGQDLRSMVIQHGIPCGQNQPRATWTIDGKPLR